MIGQPNKQTDKLTNRDYYFIYIDMTRYVKCGLNHNTNVRKNKIKT